MSNYFNDALNRILFGLGGQPGPNDRKGAQIQASQQETDMLDYLAGSSRARRKGEPGGVYALADYPGLYSATEWARGGGTPLGSGGIGQWLLELRDKDAARRGMRERQGWAQRQADLVSGWRI